MGLPKYERTLEGSVKTIKFVSLPTATKTGVAHFYVKDIYSVFDWGQMPMEEGAFLDNSSLLIESAFNFERMEQRGVRTTYRGLVMEDGSVMKLKDALTSDMKPVAMEVDIVNKLEITQNEGGGYDYSNYRRPNVTNFMVPVEWIHREAGELPDGSSFTKRMKKGMVNPVDYGLPADYRAGDPLPWRIGDESTKFEEKDAYETPRVLADKAGLSPEEYLSARNLVLATSKIYVDDAAAADLLVGDGKEELAVVGFYKGHPLFAVTDFAGTFHEVRRLIKPHGSLDHAVKHSKQSERNLHKVVDAEWCAAVNKASKDNDPNWKQVVLDQGMEPTALPREYFDAKNTLSRAVANHLIGTHLEGMVAYQNTPPLDVAAIAFDAAYKKVA